MAIKKVTTKKKKYPKVLEGIFHVNTSSNNTIINFTDLQWNKIFWSWCGAVWFKWTKESSAYAAEVLAKKIVKEAKENCGLKEATVVCKGVWLWRDWLFRAINELWWIDIASIRDVTPLQFGGTKGKRPKRN